MEIEDKLFCLMEPTPTLCILKLPDTGLPEPLYVPNGTYFVPHPAGIALHA
jgi:hypothetical protein